MSAKKTKKSEMQRMPLGGGIDSVINQPIEEWEITKLRPHPKQAELVGSYTDEEIDELAADIKANGLSHPLEALPNGCLVAGHRRMEALGRIGRTKVPVIVRYDLAEQGEAAITMYLIRDNLMRTHYHPLKIARLYKHMKEMDCAGDAVTKPEPGDVRDQLAKVFGKSGRSLDRYAAVLRTPREVQEAIERNKLTITAGEEIAHLSQADQEEIAHCIALGHSAKEVVAPYLTPRGGHDNPLRNQVAGFARTLARSQRQLEERLDEIDPLDTSLCEHVTVFLSARDFLLQLIEQLPEFSEEPCHLAGT